MIGIDDHDNGNVVLQRGYCSFSQVIANFLPIKYDAKEQEKDKAFYVALDFVLSYLDRLKKRFSYLQECKQKIKEVMDGAKHCLVFDEAISWLEIFFELGGEKHPAKFVVMPTQDHWKLRGIPPSLEKRMQVRLCQPKKWAGLYDDDLKKASNLNGAIFCHKGLFVSIWQTKEDALNALKYILKINGVDDDYNF